MDDLIQFSISHFKNSDLHIFCKNELRAIINKVNTIEFSKDKYFEICGIEIKLSDNTIVRTFYLHRFRRQMFTFLSVYRFV